jgi:hypothetical protein
MRDGQLGIFKKPFLTVFAGRMGDVRNCWKRFKRSFYGTDRRAKAAVLMIEFRVLSFRREAIALGASLSYHPLRRERA